MRRFLQSFKPRGLADWADPGALGGGPELLGGRDSPCSDAAVR